MMIYIQFLRDLELQGTRKKFAIELFREVSMYELIGPEASAVAAVLPVDIIEPEPPVENVPAFSPSDDVSQLLMFAWNMSERADISVSGKSGAPDECDHAT